MEALEGLWETRWKMRGLGPQETEGKGIGSGGTKGVKKMCYRDKGGREITGRV